MSSPQPQGLLPTARQDRWLAAALFAGSVAVLFATQAPVGFVRDESVYFAAAESYARWFEQLLRAPAQAVTDNAIVRAFEINHEHPALMKMLFGLSYLVFHQWLGALKPAAAFRIPALVAASLIPAVTYLLGRSLYGRKAGLWAATSFLLVPRQFFNAHLASFDVPIAAFWLLTVYTFLRAQREPRFWLWCGLSFGAALATKHNGWFLPLVLAPFGLVRGWMLSRGSHQARIGLSRLVGLFAGVGVLFAILWISDGPNRFVRSFAALSPASALLGLFAVGTLVVLRQLWRASESAFRAIAPIGAMAILGPAIFYLHWPYLWHHPVERAAWYFDFHATHVHYAWFYLGRLLREPPFPLDYVAVKTALTVPITIFLPMALGLGAVGLRAIAALWRRWRSLLPSFGEAVVAANAVAPILIISHPNVPHFGGVKHWFPAMVFLAILGGNSVSRAASGLVQILRERWPGVSGWATAGPLFALLFAPALIATARIHPYGTSYYSELAGGLPGAATIGMQRQFWSNNVTGVLGWLNEHAPANARVWLHEVTGLAFQEYQVNGMLRGDLLPAAGPSDAQIAAYQYHQEFREHEMNIWQAFGTQTPVTGLYLDETPQIIVYQRK
jgi:4-amino-4-deoxy-L-arabinose transferase-like glycosyltransferase